MSEEEHNQTHPLEEALRAQKALRALAGLGPETFPVQAFVGMISDEIETLRTQGLSDEDIGFEITPLRLGIECAKGQGRLTGARDPGKHDEGVPGNQKTPGLLFGA